MPKIGHDLAKQPVTIDRNHWSRLSEMTGHDEPKYAFECTIAEGLLRLEENFQQCYKPLGNQGGYQLVNLGWGEALVLTRERSVGFPPK